LPQIRSLERTQNPFRRLIQPGHEFRFIDNVQTEGQFADSDRVLQEILHRSLLLWPG